MEPAFFTLALEASCPYSAGGINAMALMTMASTPDLIEGPGWILKNGEWWEGALPS